MWKHFVFLLCCLIGDVFGDDMLFRKNDGYGVSQVHIAQGKDSSSMSIVWLTPDVSATYVHYGTSPSELNMTASGTASSYTYSDKYGSYTSGQIHTVVLEKLSPKTQYYYQCGDYNADDLSGILQFKTLPARGDSTPTSFGVVGDLGITTDAQSTLNHIMGNENLEMILHVGDLSYADCDQNKWDQYGVMIEVLASERPWMVGAGNHVSTYE